VRSSIWLAVQAGPRRARVAARVPAAAAGKTSRRAMRVSAAAEPPSGPPVPKEEYGLGQLKTIPGNYVYTISQAGPDAPPPSHPNGSCGAALTFPIARAAARWHMGHDPEWRSGVLFVLLSEATQRASPACEGRGGGGGGELADAVLLSLVNAF
jgi:hypothetical protein